MIISVAIESSPTASITLDGKRKTVNDHPVQAAKRIQVKVRNGKKVFAAPAKMGENSVKDGVQYGVQNGIQVFDPAVIARWEEAVGSLPVKSETLVILAFDTIPTYRAINNPVVTKNSFRITPKPMRVIHVTIYSAFIETRQDFIQKLAEVYSSIFWTVTDNSTECEDYSHYMDYRRLFIEQTTSDFKRQLKVDHLPLLQRTNLLNNRQHRIIFTKGSRLLSTEQAAKILGDYYVHEIVRQAEEEIELVRKLGVEREIIVRFRLDTARSKRGYCQWSGITPCFIDLYLMTDTYKNKKIKETIALDRAMMVLAHEMGHCVHFELIEESRSKRFPAEVYADAYALWRDCYYSEYVHRFRSASHFKKATNYVNKIKVQLEGILNNGVNNVSAGAGITGATSTGE